MCRLRFDTAFVIRANVDSMFLEYPSSVVLDAGGNLVLTSPRLRVPVVYDRRGRYLRELGRHGGGPGEFERVSLLSAGPGGDIYVMDAGLARVTVVGPEGVGGISGVPGLLPPGAMAVLQDGSVVLNAFAMTDSGGALPFVRLTLERGTMVRFGDPVNDFDLRRRGFLRSVLASSRDGGFWAVEYLTGVLRKYGPDLKRTFMRDPPSWFPEGQVNRPPSIGQNGVPPTTFTRAAVEDSAGRLWIVTTVPSRNWRRFAGESTRGIDAGRQPSQVSRLVASRIEVVNAKTGELIHSEVVPMMVVHALGGGRFLSYADEGDIPSVAVLEVQLSGRNGK